MSGSNGLKVKWFGCRLIWESDDFECQLIWDSSDLVVTWLEIQVVWMSNDWRFKWFGCQLMCDSNDFGCQLMWDSSDLVVIWFEIQVIWNKAFLRDFLQKSIFGSSKMKLFCETSFKNDMLTRRLTSEFQYDFGCFKSTAPATKKLSRGMRIPVSATRNDPSKVTFS